MGRLKALKPRVGTLAPRIGYASGDEKARDRQRDQLQAYRKWYRTAKWAETRMRVLVRDKFTCQQTGVLLVGKHPAANSPVVDHIIPHRGDERLFWDEDNLQSVSKAYHDSTKQAQERAAEATGRFP